MAALAFENGTIYEGGKAIWTLPDGETVQNLALYVTTYSGGQYLMDYDARVPLKVQTNPFVEVSE